MKKPNRPTRRHQNPDGYPADQTNMKRLDFIKTLTLGAGVFATGVSFIPVQDKHVLTDDEILFIASELRLSCTMAEWHDKALHYSKPRIYEPTQKDHELYKNLIDPLCKKIGWQRFRQILSLDYMLDQNSQNILDYNKRMIVKIEFNSTDERERFGNRVTKSYFKHLYHF